MHTTTRHNISSTPRPYVSGQPFDENRVGAAAVYCSDGRYGEQMDDFLHHSLGLPRYDRVAVPGGAACLAGHILAVRERHALEKQLRFLVEAHALNRLVLIAHQDCGFYKHNVHAYKLKQTPLEHFQAGDLAKAAQIMCTWSKDLVVDAYFARKLDDQIRFEAVPV